VENQKLRKPRENLHHTILVRDFKRNFREKKSGSSTTGFFWVFLPWRQAPAAGKGTETLIRRIAPSSSQVGVPSMPGGKREKAST